MCIKRMPKNWKGEAFGIFKHPICCKVLKKLKGALERKKIPKKNLAVPKKNERGDPLVLPGMVCYAEKQEKPFWFSSLGQVVQFGAIIFCRTFKNYFGQFVWIEKKSHYNSPVSLHEAPTKNTNSTLEKSIGNLDTNTSRTSSFQSSKTIEIASREIHTSSPKIWET